MSARRENVEDRGMHAVKQPGVTPTNGARGEITDQLLTNGIEMKDRLSERIPGKPEPASPTGTGPMRGQSLRHPVRPYQPFPTGTLPEPVRSFVAAGAKAIGCAEAYLAMPLLTMLGAAIGTPGVLLRFGVRYRYPALPE